MKTSLDPFSRASDSSALDLRIYHRLRAAEGIALTQIHAANKVDRQVRIRGQGRSGSGQMGRQGAEGSSERGGLSGKQKGNIL